MKPKLLVLAAPALVLTSQFSVGPLQIISALIIGTNENLLCTYRSFRERGACRHITHIGASMTHPMGLYGRCGETGERKVWGDRGEEGCVVLGVNEREREGERERDGMRQTDR